MGQHMSLADDLTQLATLRQNGTLTEAEFLLAKAKLLNQADQPDTGLREEIEEIRRFAMLQEIDRDWQIESEKHMLGRRNGMRVPPNRTQAITLMVVGLVQFVFMSGLSAFIYFRTNSDLAALILLFTAPPATMVLLYQGYTMLKKARFYEEAQTAYQARRQEAEAMLEK
jgi:hypothetical protein